MQLGLFSFAKIKYFIKIEIFVDIDQSSLFHFMRYNLEFKLKEFTRSQKSVIICRKK